MLKIYKVEAAIFGYVTDNQQHWQVDGTPMQPSTQLELILAAWLGHVDGALGQSFLFLQQELNSNQELPGHVDGALGQLVWLWPRVSVCARSSLLSKQLVTWKKSLSSTFSWIILAVLNLDGEVGMTG